MGSNCFTPGICSDPFRQFFKHPGRNRPDFQMNASRFHLHPLNVDMIGQQTGNHLMRHAHPVNGFNAEGDCFHSFPPSRPLTFILAEGKRKIDHTNENASSRSAKMSSAFSIPADRRIMPSEMPIFSRSFRGTTAWVIEAGC